MQMDGWQDYLHFDLLGEHVFFPSLRLDSARHLVEACVLTIAICVAERSLTYAIHTSWSPLNWTKRTRARKALWKAALYWVVTLLRLLYMLVAMTFSVWLLLITVTTLAAGQFIIEYLETPDYSSMTECVTNAASTSSLPRAHSSSSVNVATDPAMGRPRSKSKPDAIWIHPTESNLARADARAMQLGLSGDTELVKAPELPAEGEHAWEVGKGRDLAREIMGKPN
ncbi:hypothetical protein BC835DRAFT_1513216 [Cytidiella melzeri]|nr:hypothetical protein BC835DRAFT_1513216 [Cytidiella melzeri]